MGGAASASFPPSKSWRHCHLGWRDWARPGAKRHTEGGINGHAATRLPGHEGFYDRPAATSHLAGPMEATRGWPLCSDQNRDCLPVVHALHNSRKIPFSLPSSSPARRGLPPQVLVACRRHEGRHLDHHAPRGYPRTDLLLPIGQESRGLLEDTRRKVAIDRYFHANRFFLRLVAARQT